jgi:hypothetical protein
MRLRALLTGVFGFGLFAACSESGVSRDPEAHFRGQGGAGAGVTSAGAGQSTGGRAPSSSGGSDAEAGGAAGETQEIAPGGEGGSSGQMAGSGGGAGESADGGVAGSGGEPRAGGVPGTGGVPGASTGGSAAGSGNSAGAGNPDAVSKDALLYWFSADFGITAEDGMISEWRDRSGNEAHAVQTTPGLHPRLGDFPYSGLPAAVFDGVDDYLALPPLEASFDGGLTFFAIARATNARLCMAMLELSNGSEIEDVGFLSFKQAFSYEVFEKLAQGQLGAFGIESNLLLDVTHTPDQTVSVYINGFASGVATFPVPVNVTRTENFLGRSLYPDCLASWAGEIAELLLYARPLETQERQAVRRYLTEKWRCCGS